MEMYNDDNRLEIIETKTFHSHFDLPKDIYKNLKGEINHIIKYNGFFAEQRIKNKMRKLLSKYGNDIHEHRK